MFMYPDHFENWVHFGHISHFFALSFIQFIIDTYFIPCKYIT